MMIKVRNIRIGEGKPKICVPVTGSGTEEIFRNAAAAAAARPDLVEYRCDFFEDVTDPEKLSAVLKEIRGILKEIPLLLTFRSGEEGGACSVSDEEYLKICRTGIGSGVIDLIDVELKRYLRISGPHTGITGDWNAGEMKGLETDPCPGPDLLGQAHEKGISVVMSSHEFGYTPDEEDILARLAGMDQCGADIVKIAVMPKSREDVLTLLHATVKMHQQTRKPLITMSMGELGAVSRIIGSFTGSCITFASVGEASAPGQLEAGRMRRILDELP